MTDTVPKQSSAPFVFLAEQGTEMWLVVKDEKGLVTPIDGPLPTPESWRKAIYNTKYKG